MAPKKKIRKVPAVKVISQHVSVHDHLGEGLGSFLESAKFLEVKLVKETLTTLVGLLPNYREEGHQLFPEIFIIDDLTSALKTLPNSEQVKIGSGARTPETLGLVVKRCAPLAQFGWSIYIWPTKTGFQYGLLRCGLTALSLTASEQLIDQGEEAIPAILIRQISNQTIEISSANQCELLVHFGAAQQPGRSPDLETQQFCLSTVTDVPEHLKTQVYNFYWRLFERVLMGGHGCLAAVLRRSKRTLPLHLRDGVMIAPRIDVAARVGAVLATSTSENDTQLRATAALIRGMLFSDGVTVLRSDGSVMAYNVFVKSSTSLAGKGATFGGARRRAFGELSNWVGGELKSAFFLSQDGHAEFRGK